MTESEAEDSISLRNLILDFDLPFVLRVPDSIKKETTPDGYEQFILPVDGIPAMLRFERQTRSQGGVQFAIEDRRGLLSYSQVQVWFDSRILTRVSYEETFIEKREEYLTEAIRYVNRFVDAYSAVMGTYWIPKLVRSDIAKVMFIAIMEDGSQHPHDYMRTGTGVALGKIVRGDDDRALRNLLLAEWEPSSLTRFADLVPTLMHREEYWSAALAATIFFEARVAQLLRALFVEEGLEEAEIEGKFLDSRGRHRGITNLVKTYLPGYCACDLNDEATDIGKAYIAWGEKARDLRNDIAHGKRIAVTGAEADLAISSTRSFLECIEDRLPTTGTGVVAPADPEPEVEPDSVEGELPE